MHVDSRLRWFSLVLAALSPLLEESRAHAAVYYVRHTVGDDSNDGLSPKTAWKRISRLRALQAGDTAYVGPGLYRDGLDLQNSGTAEARITFVADNAGKYTGDPPGRVMVAGADPVDEALFLPTPRPGVYSLRAPGPRVLEVVEMDSPQFRYRRAHAAKEHLVEKLSELEVVEKLPYHFFYDEKAQTLYIHTSDGKAPRTHEIELVRRGNGIFLGQRHYVTVIGFTFRHMGDAGISFFRGAGDGAAFFNTSYGSRQGIRVFEAPNTMIYGNTLFRNENSGVYFADRSVNGSAIRNVTYENLKGIRWGSKSGNAVAVENVAFENLEAGIALEDVGPATVWSNRVGNNRAAQLLALDAKYTSDGNCFERGGPEQFLADFFPYPRNHRFKTLRDYQEARGQDLGSRESGCGPWPEKVDVHKLHAESMAYRDRALKILAAAASEAPRAPATPTPQPP